MSNDGITRLSHLVVIALGASLVAYVGAKYLLTLLLPFFIAWSVAFVMRPPTVYLSSRLHVSVRILRPVLTLLALAVILFLLGGTVYLVAVEVWGIVSELGEGEALGSFISSFGAGELLSPLLGSLGSTVEEGIAGAVSTLVSRLFDALSSLAASLPRVLLFVVITLIATLYFSLDLERINAAVLSVVPRSWGRALVRFKDGMLSAVGRYLRSYLLLFLITFGTVLVGLTLLGVRYALLTSLLTAFLDLLPVIGIGAVLLPMAAVKLAMGETLTGVGLIVLFLLATLVRELAEPRILGKSLGLHPLAALIVLYVGYSLFGLSGILLVPVITALVGLYFNKKKSPEVDER